MRREESFTVGERASLDVDLTAGNLQVQVGSAGVIRVGIESAKAGDFEIVQMGDTVSVASGSRWGSGRSVRMVVEVPMRAEVSIKGVSLDVVLRGTLGGVRCRTTSGDLQADEVDRIEASSSSGDVRIAVVNGDATFNTASGDIVVTNAHGRLAGQTASGDLTADLVGHSLEVGTASGDVRVGCCGGSEINVKTVSGNIRLGLPIGIRVDPDISTMSGTVSLPTAAAPAGQGADGSVARRPVRVRLRSVSGDIRIDRAG